MNGTLRNRSVRLPVPKPQMSVTNAPATKTAGTHQPKRRLRAIVSGLIVTTIRYTARNHSGPKGTIAAGGETPRSSCVSPQMTGPRGRPISVRCRTTWITIQTHRNTSEGRSSRAARVRMNAQVGSPRRMNES